MGESGLALFRDQLMSLVLPAYNPGPVLANTLTQLRTALAERAEPWEVLVVLDGCSDGSERVARSWLGRLPGLRILNSLVNRGKGHAVRAGLNAARGTWRIFTDIDLAYAPSEIFRLAERLRAGVPLVIASRRHSDSRVELPTALLGAAQRRQLQSAVFAALVRLLLPISHADTQAGLKGMSAALARAIVPQLRCDGFGIDCELLMACARLGIQAEELPVTVRYDRADSTVSASSIVRTLRELWRIRRAGRALPLSAPEPSPDMSASRAAA